MYSPFSPTQSFSLTRFRFNISGPEAFGILMFVDKSVYFALGLNHGLFVSPVGSVLFSVFRVSKSSICGNKSELNMFKSKACNFSLSVIQLSKLCASILAKAITGFSLDSDFLLALYNVGNQILFFWNLAKSIAVPSSLVCFLQG